MIAASALARIGNVEVTDPWVQEYIDAVDEEMFEMAFAIFATMLVVIGTISLVVHVCRQLASPQASTRTADGTEEEEDDDDEDGDDERARKKGASRIRDLGRQLGRRKGHDKLRTSDAEVEVEVATVMPTLLVDDLELPNELHTSDAEAGEARRTDIPVDELDGNACSPEPDSRRTARTSSRSKLVAWVCRLLRRLYRKVLVPLSWY